MKLLLTAFEPFGGHATNASQEVAQALQAAHFEGARLEILILPVDYERAPQQLLGAIERLQPDLIILLGEAWSRDAITPERVAINIDDFAIPDNGGHQPREQSIFAGAPAAYFSTLPLAAMRAALESEGVPAAISNSAGTFLCNHVFYRVMHHLSQTKSAAPAGFIHVPLLVEEASRSENQPAMVRATVIRGVQIAMETCLSLAATSLVETGVEASGSIE